MLRLKLKKVREKSTEQKKRNHRVQRMEYSFNIRKKKNVLRIVGFHHCPAGDIVESSNAGAGSARLMGADFGREDLTPT